MNKKHIVKIIGLVLILISAIFLIRRIISLNVNLADLLTPVNMVIVAVISLAGIVVVFINSVCWKLCLRLFSDRQISARETFSVYARANIMKYLPGNVGHYAGRQLYGSQLGIKQLELATATILELAYSTLSMLLCTFSISAKVAEQAMAEHASSKTLLLIGVLAGFVVLIVCVFFFLFRKNKYIQVLLKLIQTLRFWRTFFICVLLNAFDLLIIALGYVMLLGQYTALNLQSVMMILSSNFVAIFVGYITPGVPGGIGVRETVLTVILLPYFSEDIVILATCSHRIATILMDLLAVPVSGLFAAGRRKIKQIED